MVSYLTRDCDPRLFTLSAVTSTHSSQTLGVTTIATSLHTLGRPVVLITQDEADTSLPFDCTRVPAKEARLAHDGSQPRVPAIGAVNLANGLKCQQTTTSCKNKKVAPSPGE